MSKYEALGQFLKSQNTQLIPLTFADIERIIGATLPASAHKHRPWWSNNGDNSALTRVWLEAGFKSEQVDMEAQKLVFRRIEDAREFPGTGQHPLRGALKGLLRVMEGTDITKPADPDWGNR